MKTCPRSPRAGLLSALVLVVAVTGLLPACAPADGARVDDRPPGATAAPLAERHTWGGMCPGGPCTSTLTVHDDGSWRYHDEATRSQGLLGARELERLQQAVRGTGLTTGATPAASGRSGAPTVGCEAHHDGRSVRYGWSSFGRGWRSADSCEQAIDPKDPLVRRLEELAGRLPP